MSDKKVREVVIGGGWAGRQHGRGALLNKQAELQGVQDISAEVMEEFCSEIEAPASTRHYTSLDAVIGDPDVDAVVISSVSNTHVPILEKVLNAGKHAIVEKPIGTTWEYLLNAKRLAEDHTDQITMANLAIRYYAVAQKMKDIVDSGVLGQVYGARFTYSHRVNTGKIEEVLAAMAENVRISPGDRGKVSPKDWKFLEELSGGAVLMGGLHAEDCARWLLKEQSDVVAVMGKSNGPWLYNLYDHPTCWEKYLIFNNREYDKEFHVNVRIDVENPHGYDFHITLTGTEGQLIFRSITDREGGYELLFKPKGSDDYEKIDEGSGLIAPNSGAVEHHNFGGLNNDFTAEILAGRKGGQHVLAIQNDPYITECMSWGGEVSDYLGRSSGDMVRVNLADLMGGKYNNLLLNEKHLDRG